MSTYSTSLKLTLIGDGEQSGVWGQTTNTNLGTLLEEAITGVVAITMSDANYTLSNFNGVSDEARNAVLVVGGTNTAQRNLIAPAVEKLYTVKNSTGQNLQIKTSGGTGVVIPNGMTTTVYCNGTDFFEQKTGSTGAFAITGNATVGGNAAITGTLDVTGTTTLSTALAITSGGTGATSASNARTNLGLGTIATQNSNSVTITGGSISGITDLAIADGGTGASTANAALNNLLPSQTGNNGKYLKSDGTDSSWDAIDISTSDVSGTLAVANGGTGSATAGGARTNLGLGTIATQNANSVSITGGSITGITDLAVADGGTGASDAATARTNLGLGTISTQNSSAVTITGGSISGITDLAVADGGTGASTAADARTNLGLGTMATQNANSVNISGGTITGSYALTSANVSGTVAVANGGTGATDAATARTNLGLGTIATQAASNVSITGGSITGITDLAVADGGTGASTAADARTNLSVPSTTGSGASGTWGIGISGNAGTVTNGVYTTNFTGSNQSIGTSGYQKLPGGLIMQWGYQNNANGNVTFPLAFPTACISVQSTWSQSDNNVYATVLQSITTTGFSQKAYNGNGTLNFYWFAIGY